MLHSVYLVLLWIIIHVKGKSCINFFEYFFLLFYQLNVKYNKINAERFGFYTFFVYLCTRK